VQHGLGAQGVREKNPPSGGFFSSARRVPPGPLMF
jgi:hypothetical protein